ncbi:MAG: cytidylate kinase [SAR202 cluster bacterium Io17-Chloro-G3]|nr:MAG: cytidylate kinase [SAR202 cluster bacterium Io17-Chloro-G3]
MNQPIVIAIDGPVASGKTAVGRLLAQRLGYKFLDTGLLYRAITLLALESGLDLSDEQCLVEIANPLPFEVSFDDAGEVSLFASGRDIAPFVNSPEVAEATSRVAVVLGVRMALLPLQRQIAEDGRVVMVGRDIGTVVVPKASLKLYLTACSEERTRRRYQEFLNQGRSIEYREVQEQLIQRDYRDEKRAVAPLRKAKDAKLLKTDGLTEIEVVQSIVELLENS